MTRYPGDYTVPLPLALQYSTRWYSYHLLPDQTMAIKFAYWLPRSRNVPYKRVSSYEVRYRTVACLIYGSRPVRRPLVLWPNWIKGPGRTCIRIAL